ncbi:MAG: hypothetical protein AABY22_12210, partial [Nanoarchaeota archaeon]
IGGIGHQYEEIIESKPEVLIWQDPRAQTQYGSFWEIEPIDQEWCLVSIPRQALIDVGGIDILYDTVAACSEKEANLRMDKAGYRFYLDSSLEYRAFYHPRIQGQKEWDKHYELACKLLEKHIHEIISGNRLKLDYL